MYVFDETNRDPNNERPDRKYVFTKEQLASHYSKSKLGHSYSVWIPWDDAGGPQKELSLIVRFAPEKGGVVVGEQTKHILPGKTEIAANNSGGPWQMPNAQAIPFQAPIPPGGSIRAASYVTPLPPVDAQKQGGEQNGINASRRMNTTTIQVPQQSSLNMPAAMGEYAKLRPTQSGIVAARAGRKSHGS